MDLARTLLGIVQTNGACVGSDLCIAPKNGDVLAEGQNQTGESPGPTHDVRRFSGLRLATFAVFFGYEVKTC